MNHYELYGWNDFDQWGLSAEKAAWETLGYDQEKWDTAVSTEFDDLWFAELPEDVQTALEDFLCYTEELWNEVPLDFWLEDAMVPGSFSDESVESSLGVSLRSEIQWWSFLNICTLSVAIYSFV